MNQLVKTALIEEFLSKNNVTKCPPGSAVGANDLKNWAERRLSGRSYFIANDNNSKSAKHLTRRTSR